MDPKKNKPKTGSQPMNVDPNMAARMGNLPAGGRKNIRVRKLSDEEKAQSRQSKVKRGLENLTGRSFGGGEPTAGGDIDPKTGNLLPADPRRPKKKRNVSGPAGPGDIDPETGDLIGESVLHERNMTSLERRQASTQRVAAFRERKAAGLEAKKRNIMTTPGSGLSRETAAGNQAMYDRKDAADANLKRLEAGRKTKTDFMAQNKAERDAKETQIKSDFDTGARVDSNTPGYALSNPRTRSTPMDAPTTSPSNPTTPAPKPVTTTPAPAPTIAAVAQQKFNYNPTARAAGFGGRSSRRGLGLGGSRSGGELQATSARRLGEGVKKAGHPESFELGLDAETTDNPEYQKILRQKRIERAKQMLNPKLVRTMGDDVSQDDIEAADRAARRRKRVDEAMGNENSEYQKILQSMRANDPVLRTLRGAKPAGDGMVSVKPTNLSKAEDKKLERASRRKFNPRNVGKDAY